MRIDRYGLCFQCLQALTGFIPVDELKAWIGRLGAMSPNDFKPFAEELSLVANCVLADDSRSLLPVHSLNHLSYTIKLGNESESKASISKSLILPDGGIITFNDPVIDRIAKLHPSETTTRKICAGVSRLKTALETDPTPSRQRMSEIVYDISHQTNVDPRVDTLINEHSDEILNELFARMDTNIPREFSPILFEPANPHKHSMYVTDSLKIGSTSRNQLAPYNLRQFIRSNQICDLYYHHRSEFISTAFLGFETENSRFINEPTPLGYNLPIGKINLIPKPGDKYRVVAEPHLLLNALGYPMMRILKWINHQWKIQAVDDQQSGVRWLQEQLARKQRLRRSSLACSFDSKSWTDYFPYSGFQRKVLQQLVKRGVLTTFDLDVMDICCYSDWVLDNGDLIRYETGTPQGTKPSFACGSFSHGFGVGLAFKMQYPDRPINPQILPCRICGDDIVILDTKVAEKYEVLMRDYLRMIISKEKSIKSSTYAEFCQCAIKPDGYTLKSQANNPVTYDQWTNRVLLFPDTFPIYEIQKEFHKKALNTLEPYGLKDIADFNPNDPYDIIVMACRKLGELEEFSSVPMKRKHVQILFERLDILPELIIGENISKEFPVYQYVLSSLEQSVIDQAHLIKREMMRPGRSLHEMCTFAQEFHTLCKMASEMPLLFHSAKRPVMDGNPINLPKLDRLKREDPNKRNKDKISMDRFIDDAYKKSQILKPGGL